MGNLSRADIRAGSIKVLITYINNTSLRGIKQFYIYKTALFTAGCFRPHIDTFIIVNFFNKRLWQLVTVVMLTSFHTPVSAQSSIGVNAVFRPEIKSVECYNASKESSFPVITLNSPDQIFLGFDDLTGQARNYYYTLQHCEADWSPSNLSPAEYLQSFMEDRLLDYVYSSGTLQKYVHYEIKLPNQNISVKLSGNYLLKVYENSNQNQPVLTRRIYIVAPRVNLLAEVAPSNDIALKNTNQKINFAVDYASLPVQNPYNDIRIVVMQNSRPETAVFNTRPAQLRGTQLLYNDIGTNDFSGGNEFRLFDARTLKLNSQYVYKIYRDTANTIILVNEFPRSQPNYIFQYDNDGNFFIRNQDGRDPRTDADYAHVYLNLAANKTPQQGNAYVVGKFNDYRLDEHSRMSYDPVKNHFYIDLLLKQGIYDYQYVWADKAGQTDYTLLEGSHFETENDYQLLVYYRPAGARWEELVGYKLLNTGTQK